MPELLGCPFCGEQPTLSGVTQTTITCQNDQCIIWGAATAFNNYGHRADAIAAWNRRSPVPAPDAPTRPTLEELRRLVAALQIVYRDYGEGNASAQARDAADAALDSALVRLCQPSDAPKVDWERVCTWMRDANRKPANTAFTADARPAQEERT